MSKVYPNLEDFVIEQVETRDSDEHRRHSDTNCGQIFAKSSTITREFIDKLEEAEIGPSHVVVCGREFRSKEIWVLLGLSFLFLASVLGSVLMFGTGMFDSFILSKMVLKPGTEAYDRWTGPYASTFIKVYIFNYTNVDEFERGIDAKLRVSEAGPYVYEEWTTKVNVVSNGNGTVSYREHRRHKFRPDLSKGRRQSDRVIVPNMPMLGAAAVSEHTFFWSRFAMSTLLSGLNSKPFLKVPAHRFIWGYDDHFYDLAKGVMSYQGKMPLEKVGILTARNGTSDDVITIGDGSTSIDQLGQIDNFNGKVSIDHWSTEDCDRIPGSSDGMFFPPHAIRQRKPVYTYLKALCRRFQFNFEREVSILDGRVRVLRYVLPDNIYDEPETNAENQCYCDLDSGTCPPRGLFNATPCSYGVPIFISAPHFHNADPVIYEHLAGLRPDAVEHQSYVDVHPTLGFTVAGVSRLQTNIQVKKSFGMSQLDMFKEDVVLPMTWVEAGLEEHDLPDNVREDIYVTCVTLPIVERCLKCVCLLTAFVTLAGLGLVLRAQQRRTASSSGRRQSDQDSTIS